MKKVILFFLSAAIVVTTEAQSKPDAKTASNENPVAIGMTNSVYVTKSQLKRDPVLHMPEANKDYHITSYQLSYVPNGKASDVQGPFVIKGSDMTTGQAAEILNKVQPGDRVFFEEIVAVSDDKTKQPMKLNAAIKIQ
jgi:hypothetical protein